MSIPVAAHASAHDPALIYLASLAPSGRRTMRAKLASVTRLVGADAGTLRWADLRFEHVTAIRAELQAAGKSPATINATLSALRGVARAAWHMNQISAEDYHRIQAVRSVPGARLLRGRALAAGELAALMAACAADETAAGARDAALIALLFAAGLRRSECVALDAGDYTEATGGLRVRGKGNKERIVYPTGGGAGALADWLAVRGAEPGPLVVPVRRWGHVQLRRMTDQAIYSALLKRVREANLKPTSPHDLRPRSSPSCSTAARMSPPCSGSPGTLPSPPRCATTAAAKRRTVRRRRCSTCRIKRGCASYPREC